MTNDLAHLAIEALPASVALLDAAGTILWVNATWQQAVGGDEGYAVGADYLATCDVAGAFAEDARLAGQGIRAVLTGDREQLSFDYGWTTAHGPRRYRLFVRHLERAEGGAVLLYVDISGPAAADRRTRVDAQRTTSAERRALEQRMRELALYDSLTGLPNRVLLFDRIEHALLNSSRRDGRIAVLLALDGFDAVSKQQGRSASEELLIEAGRRLRPVLRAGDTAARYATDEFVILLLDIRSLPEAVAVAERIVRAFDRPFEVGQGEVSIRASIGVSSEWSHLHTADALIEAAATALLQARESGVRRVVLFEGDIF